MSSNEHSELLAELLWLADGDPRRSAILDAHPELAERLDELERTRVELDSRFDRAREDDLGGEADSELEERSLEALRASIADDEAAAPASPLRLRPRYILLGAAAAALLIWIFRPVEQPTDPGPPRLWLNASDESAEAHPTGVVSSVERFEWSIQPKPGAVQRVQIWLGPSNEGPPDFQSPDRTGPAWTPEAEVLNRLVGELRWSVTERNPINGESRTILEAAAVVDP